MVTRLESAAATRRALIDAGVRAASRAQEEFLSIVAAVVGPDETRRYGALLFTSAHGIAGTELSGHLTREKWDTTAEDIVGTLVAMTERRPG
ncbi:hypothetical protein OG943_25725 [Amycolatopsis sp. NBC_00345]|uniref:hypothetical protein n=1 Tax=Amycolatopsis sp. NBC_00345 TaxID=2975955 RepID=UPI002E25A0BD